MTKFSKVLTVFIVFVSVAFMGVALAIHSTGPNWEEHFEKLPDYDFTYSAGENPTWSVQHRETDAQNLGSARQLPSAIMKAYTDATSRNTAATEQATAPLQGIQQQIADAKATIEPDRKGVLKRYDALTQTLEDVSKKVSDLALAADRLAKQANATREEAAERRDDKVRLLRQLQQIEADQFYLAEQKSRLLDTMYQLQGELRRLKIRNTQLIEQGATLDSPAPVGETASETTAQKPGLLSNTGDSPQQVVSN